MPPSRHSAHPAHHPHPNARGPHHGPGANGPHPSNGSGERGGNGPPMHPHGAYGQSMPPPDLPAHAMNGAGGAPPRMMMGADGPGGTGPPPPPPPHIPRSSSAASHHMMDVGPTGGPPTAPPSASSAVQKLTLANERTWISIGAAAEAMEDFERALSAYESALRHNPYSVDALGAIAGVHRTLDNFEKAVDYFQRSLNILPENGDTWGSMGHCYLMMDDLQRAYTAYQQALYHLPNPKEPKLWYGIGILYDRYGSLEHAEEAFASVVRMDPNYEKANEIYFRLGIIYKQQNKFSASLECFRYILTNPPRPLTEIDIWFQIGHVHEQQKDFAAAKEAYERVLAENPSHAKVLQQLGWLYHQSNAGFTNQERAIQFLTQSLESDPNDAQSWYLLGRAYMAGQNYNKAYEAYQQAVYRDGKNPTFWCSIGVLYYQINQFRDALDAYSRAIRLNPFISEVWFDLGSLYESCNNQISDAIDAYARAAELDPDNPQIQQRLMLLRNAEAKGEQVPSAPMPQDVHPTAYANNNGMPPGPPSQIGGGPPLPPPGGGYGPPPPMGSAPPPLAAPGSGREMADRELPGPGHLHQQQQHPQQPGQSPPFRGGPPPIPNIDERGTRGPTHTPLAPMNTSQSGGPGPGHGPGGEPHHRGPGYPHHPQSRGPSPAPRGDMYGRRMGSPPRQTPPAGPPGSMRGEDGYDFRGGPHGPHPGAGPPVDHYGRPLNGPAALAAEREREREMEWERERERAARQYPGSGRATPKNEPGYARSQHGSNAPSPAFSRPGAYPRDDPREYYGNGGYERARMEDSRPPYEHERPYGRHPDHMGERYEGGARQHPPADLRGPTPERERLARVSGEYPPMGHLGGPPPPYSDAGGDGPAPGAVGGPGVRGAASKARRGPKGKDDGEAPSGPASPAPSAAAARKRKDAGGVSSRASSPWGGRQGGSNAAAGGRGGGPPSRSESRGPGGGRKSGGPGGLNASWKGRDGGSVSGSRANSPEPRGGRPGAHQDVAAAAAAAARAASPASSTGSNEPLAARAPSRVVDEDYDEGAADALMGLAGAASASASMPAPTQKPLQPPSHAGEREQPSPRGYEGGPPQWEGSSRPGARKTSDPESMYGRAESALGKRPYEERDTSASLEESAKRARNGASPIGSKPNRNEDASDSGARPDGRSSSPLKAHNGTNGADDGDAGVKSPPLTSAARRSADSPTRSPAKDAGLPRKDEARGTPPKQDGQSTAGKETPSGRDMDVDEDKPTSGAAGAKDEGSANGSKASSAVPASDKDKAAGAKATTASAAAPEDDGDNEEEGQITESGDEGKGDAAKDKADTSDKKAAATATASA